MADYDYKAGKQRLEEILDNDMEVVEQDKLPNDDDFTFTNGYYSWVSAIFVDMRDSTELCADEDKEKLAKVFRSFSSEIIEILRDDDNLREIGIRGDCVYAVYTSPLKTDIYECADKCFYINTFMKMLNRLLKQHSLPEIKVGIGLSSAQELVVKAGRKGVGINSKIWIGKAVTRACHYANYGNKDGNPAIVFGSCSYNNMIDQLIKNDPDKNPKEWFTYHKDEGEGDYYTANIIKTGFDNWISSGMIID
jgi:hypothetical protein